MNCFEVSTKGFLSTRNHTTLYTLNKLIYHLKVINSLSLRGCLITFASFLSFGFCSFSYLSPAVSHGGLLSQCMPLPNSLSHQYPGTLFFILLFISFDFFNNQPPQVLNTKTPVLVVISCPFFWKPLLSPVLPFSHYQLFLIAPLYFPL